MDLQSFKQQATNKFLTRHKIFFNLSYSKKVLKRATKAVSNLSYSEMFKFHSFLLWPQKPLEVYPWNCSFQHSQIIWKFAFAILSICNVDAKNAFSWLRIWSLSKCNQVKIKENISINVKCSWTKKRTSYFNAH